jgi:hypothetical protein
VLERRASAVGGEFECGDPLAPRRWWGNPSQPEGRGQRLAHGADQRDDVGSEELHRPDRIAVVAELGVVVVLDHETADLTSPRHELGAPGGREHVPQRELMGRRHDDGAHVGSRELVDDEPVGVDRDRHRPKAVGGQVRADRFAPGVFNPDRCVAGLAQGRGEEGDRLRCTGGDHE